MIRERHGIPDARKISMVTTEIQGVAVTDGDGEVLLSLGSSSYPAGMTSGQARFIAAQLIAAADRVDDRMKPGPDLSLSRGRP